MTIVINGTTGISGVDGSAGTPAVQGTDGNTGVFYPAADTVGVSTGGSERMRVDSSGNVGIGTSSPSARVDNTGTFRSTGATDPSSGTGLELSYRSTYGDVLAYNRTSSAFVQLQVRGEPIIFGNSGGERMRIDSSGNVGIGTSSINSRITVTATNNYSDTYGIIQAYNTGTSASDNASVTVKNYSGTGQFMQWENIGLRIGSRILTNTGAGNVVFTYGNDTEGMRLDSSGNLKFNSGYGSVATAYGCRAWVNFNGTGTVAIRASGNVTSITDNGVGDYTVNFTNAMPDANYSVSATSDRASSTLTNGGIFNVFTSTTPTTSAVRLITFQVSVGVYDPTYANVAIFR